MGPAAHRLILWLWGLHLASAIALNSHFGTRSEPEEVIATCQEGFSWMSNQAGKNPCELNSAINKMCMDANSTWFVPPAGDASLPYQAPSKGDGTANVCTCSWAAYNTISACAACQGVSGGIYNWTAYTLSCSGLLSPGYLPSNVTTAGDASIPVWAIQDPMLWPGNTFNVTKASAFKDKGDVIQASVQPPSGSPTQLGPHSFTQRGPIVIGTCAGAVSLLVLVVSILKIRRMVVSKNGHKQPYHLIPFPSLGEPTTTAAQRTRPADLAFPQPQSRFTVTPFHGVWVGFSKGKAPQHGAKPSALLQVPPSSPSASRRPPPSYREFD